MSEFISNCPKCRQQILCDTAYVGKRVACPICLQEIIMPAPPQQSAPTQPQQGAPSGGPQKRSPMLMIGIIGGVVVVLGGIGAFFAFHKGSETGSASPAPTGKPPVATVPAAPAQQPIQTPVQYRAGNSGGRTASMPPHQLSQSELDLVLGLKHGCLATSQNGVSEIFAVDPATGFLQQKSNSGSGTAWSAWSRISGDTETFVGRPAAIFRPDGGEEVFVQSRTDHSMEHFYRASSTESWNEGSLGGNFASDPCVILNGNGYIEVFATDSDGNLAHNWNTGAGKSWQSWGVLASDMKGRPAAVSRTDGGAEVFVLKSDDSMGHFAHPSFSAAWKPTTLYGSNFASEPCTVQNANTSVSVFCVKSNGTLWYNYNHGTATQWAGWAQLNTGVTLLTSDLTATVNRSGETEVFGCQASDHQFGYLVDGTDGWSAWGLVPNVPE